MINLGEDHADDQRRAGKALQLLLAPLFGQRPFPLLGQIGEIFADLDARIAAIEDKTPGCQAAMIGHPRGDADHGFDLRIAWTVKANGGIVG